MRIRVGIEGMCCKNCTVHLTKALKSISGVDKVRVSLRTNDALIHTKQELNELDIKKAIEEEGYQAVSVEKFSI